MKRVEKKLGNTLLPPPPPLRCISLIQFFLETANIFLPIFFEVQFIIKPHDVSRCVWLFDVINNAILRNVFISVFKHLVFLVFDAIWLGHYLRLLSNTHLLLWSENVENRNKKTGVNSLFRSKNLTNKRRGCTWKYIKKSIQVWAILHWEIVFAWKTCLQRNYLRVYCNKLWGCEWL